MRWSPGSVRRTSGIHIQLTTDSGHLALAIPVSAPSALPTSFGGLLTPRRRWRTRSRPGPRTCRRHRRRGRGCRPLRWNGNVVDERNDIPRQRQTWGKPGDAKPRAYLAVRRHGSRAAERKAPPSTSLLREATCNLRVGRARTATSARLRHPGGPQVSQSSATGHARRAVPRSGWPRPALPWCWCH
jgi:hypothetical protein